MLSTRGSLYKRWWAMIDRCCNRRSSVFHHYGGRGIKVCSEWRDSFDAFYLWAETNGFRMNLELDREDNDGNYEPSNCRWVTRRTSNNNKSTSLRGNVTPITFHISDAVFAQLSETAKREGVKRAVVARRWVCEGAAREGINVPKTYKY